MVSRDIHVCGKQAETVQTQEVFPGGMRMVQRGVRTPYLNAQNGRRKAEGGRYAAMQASASHVDLVVVRDV